jgi:hypothetical protein
MSNPKDKVHYSAAKLNDPNKAPMTGNEVSDDRAHIQSGPQTASRHTIPAPAFTKVKPGK